MSELQKAVLILGIVSLVEVGVAIGLLCLVFKKLGGGK